MTFSSSIRTRLPLSYAGIALLATLALGAVLLLILQQFYRQQELDYLRGNAEAISGEVADLLGADIPTAVLQAQLQGFSFLSQTRVRLLNEEMAVLVDSGALGAVDQSVTVAVDFNTEIEVDEVNFTRESTQTTGNNQVETRIVVTNGLFSQDVTETVIVNGDDEEVVSELSTIGTPYGFGLNRELPSDELRSDQVVLYPVISPLHNEVGFIELSEGPAYGREILASVANAWAISSVVAMGVAAVVGWFASRRLTRPLLELTEATTAMSSGNLAARAAIKRVDELGTLAHSFNQMADQLEETILTLRRFVADAAHELNTPLTALRTNLELAAGAEATPHLAQAQGQVQRLEQLTAGLLNLSTLEGQTTADYRPLDFNALVQESGELFASQAEQREIEFVLQVPETPLMVQGHTAALRQAVDNLLENALKFTEANGRVVVTLSAEEEQVQLEICDTGIGIPAEDVPHLFGRFFRGHNTANYPGSGLGLAIAQTIVRQHGGEIGVRPLTKGTCFIVRLSII
ncbi:MAG: HAMP domain-containing histidine kinase [Anaerolineales bacterium]|nr:HAMP domain-containing histidine kinase [Anaerolineales bacterium]